MNRPHPFGRRIPFCTGRFFAFLTMLALLTALTACSALPEPLGEAHIAACYAAYDRLRAFPAFESLICETQGSTCTLYGPGDASTPILPRQSLPAPESLRILFADDGLCAIYREGDAFFFAFSGDIAGRTTGLLLAYPPLPDEMRVRGFSAKCTLLRPGQDGQPSCWKYTTH